MLEFIRRKSGTGRLKLRTIFVSLLAIMMLLCVLGLSLVWEPRVTRVMAASQVQNLETNVEILSDALVPFLLQNQFAGILETLSSMQEQHANWELVSLHGMDGRKYYPLSDVPAVTGTHTISAQRVVQFDGQELAILVVSVDISDEVGEIQGQVRDLTILISLFFLGALILLGLLFERLVVRRVSFLAAAAKHLSEGNYEAQIVTGTRDEIGLLAESFGTMRSTIQDNQSKLIASRDEAQRAAEAKTRFLAMMSHEIRTPLNGVIPIAELLLEEELTPQQTQLVGTIQESGKALNSIINDILDITKLDEGKFVVRSEEFSINKLVMSVASMFQVAASAKGVKIETNIDDCVAPNLKGDADRLRQVLINLVGNAVKFTPEGSVELRVSAVPVDGASSQFRFEVRDTGIGVAKQDQKKVFERFTQVDNRSNREFQGSGLGLSICQLLVSAMGGELKLESEEGVGSKFYFVLPLDVLANTQPTIPEETPSFAAPPVDSKMEQYSVLVVDDNKTNLKIANAILRKLEHQVSTVESGYDALERLADEQFDLVLMDVNMPGIDGLETTRRIRKGPPAMAQTFVLGLSASAFSEDVEQCLAAGMDGFLPKPLSKKALIAAMTEHMAQSAADVA